jgi:hypothetical protein
MREHCKAGYVVRNMACLGLLFLALPGCEMTMTSLVGKDKNAPGPVAPPPAPPPQLNTAFVAESTGLLGSTYGGPMILPPTLPAKPTAAFDDEPQPAASSGPHKALAAIPLTSDPAALAPLGAAANRAAPGPDSRFVLLVLAPPAPDATTLDNVTTASRLTANAAVKALGQAGIPADHIDVSLATTPNAGTGEMRLYQR